LAPEGAGAGADSSRTTIEASTDAMLPAARGGGRRDLYLPLAAREVTMRVTALCLTVLASASAHAQVAPGTDFAADLRSGKSYIATPVFSEDDDRKLLALFDGLRVADVTDGMDAAGLQNVGLMDPGIRPLCTSAGRAGGSAPDGTRSSR